MGDKDQSTKTMPADAAEPTPEQVKRFEEWLRAQNSQAPFSPFRIDPVLTTILHQQQPAQQTPPEARRPVAFVVPSGQQDNSRQDSKKGQGSATRLPFASSEAAAKPGWGEQTVNRLPGDGSFSEFVRYGFPIAKEGLAETGKMVALPFAWAGKVMAHPFDPIQGFDEAQKLKYRWFPNAPKTWSESGQQASEMALRPVRELAGERQPNVSIMEEDELSRIGPGFAAYQQPWWRRTEMAMSAFTGGNPDAARRHAANAWVARSQGDEKTADRETGRAVAEFAAKPLATWWVPDAKDVPGVIKDVRDLGREIKGAPHVPPVEPRVAPRAPEPSVSHAPEPSTPQPIPEPRVPEPSAGRPRSEPATPRPPATAEAPKSVPKEQAAPRSSAERAPRKPSPVKEAKSEAPSSASKEPPKTASSTKQPSVKTRQEKAAAISQVRNARKAAARGEGVASPGRRAAKPEAPAASARQAKAAVVKQAQSRKKHGK